MIPIEVEFPSGIISPEKMEDIKNRVNNLAEEVKNILEEFSREIEEIGKRYEEAKQLPEEEYEEEISRIEEIEQNLYFSLDEKFHSKARELSFKYVDYKIDSVCLMNCPMGIPNIWRDYWEIIFTDEQMEYIRVVISVSAQNYREISITKSYTFYDDMSATLMLSTKEGGFAERLMDNIDWNYIRDTWYPSIMSMMYDIIVAEYKGLDELAQAIEDVIKQLKQGFWIYDYMHVYRALLTTIEEFPEIKEKIKLEEYT